MSGYQDIESDQIRSLNETIEIQSQLIELLYSQVIDLTMMSKIELGDDVCAEIVRLKRLLNGK